MSKPIPLTISEACEGYESTAESCICPDRRDERRQGGSYVCPERGDRICKHIHHCRQLANAAAAPQSDGLDHFFGWSYPQPSAAPALCALMVAMLNTPHYNPMIQQKHVSQLRDIQAITKTEREMKLMLAKALAKNYKEIGLGNLGLEPEAWAALWAVYQQLGGQALRAPVLSIAPKRFRMASRSAALQAG